jgi:hypothetical protein
MRAFRILSVLLLVALAVFAPGSAHAVIVGEGVASTEPEAKELALADLSLAISVQVTSEFDSIQRQVGQSEFAEVSSVVQLRSDLPIIGAQFSSAPRKREIVVRAELDPMTAARLYEEQLMDILKELESALASAGDEATPARKRHDLLNTTLSLMDRYYKYKVVALMLGARGIEALPVTEAEVRSRIAAMEEEAGSMDLAARLAMYGMKQRGIYVYPPSAGASHEVTEFGAAMRDRMESELSGQTVTDPTEARFRLKGSYEANDAGMDLTVRLYDMNGAAVETRVVRLKPAAYARYKHRPETTTFDQLLHEGIVLSNEFRAEVATRAGSRDLLFGQGQSVELLVKLNRTGYFYLAGHVVKDTEKHSYLVELLEVGPNDDRDRRFIQYIGPDEVNKWISLGEFEVVPPYGVESVQMIASTEDLAGQLPRVTFDRDAGLYMVAKDPSQGVTRVRALRPKRTAERLSAESVLMFTTMGQH